MYNKNYVKVCYFIPEIGLYHYEADEKVKEAKAATLFNETIPYYVEKLDAQAKKNNGHLAVGRVSLCKSLWY